MIDRNTTTKGKESSKTKLVVIMACVALFAMAEASVVKAATMSAHDADTLQQALQSTASGDVIELATGEYGSLALKFRDAITVPLTIKAATSATPVFDNIQLHATPDITFEGIEIRPPDNRIAFEVRRGSDGVVLRDSLIAYADHAEAINWTPAEWQVRAGIAVSVRNSAAAVIEDVSMYNSRFGVVVYHDAPGAQVVNNVIDGFSGDALRGLGNDALFENNLVQRAYKVDGNHDDGFQSWSTSGMGVHNVTLRNNVFNNFVNTDHPLYAEFQGIGLFGGFYHDWVIENNVVLVDHYHGISVYGADNVLISHNTVLDLNDTRPGPARIHIFDHKDGRPSRDSVVSNNIANSFLWGTTTPGVVTYENNLEIAVDEYNDYFVDISAFDVRLRSDAPQHGAGAK